MGTLYLVGTPIGNLEDITQRQLRILREVDVIAAEDTRNTRKLLSHFDLHTPLVSYHEHNMRTMGPKLIERIQGGGSVALVTDAGMPAISDPGEDLVRMAAAAGLSVVAIPGPTAFTTALVISGLSTERFVFEGFLPHKKKDRREALERLKAEPRTWMIYEAPHRVIETLGELHEALGARPMAAARELTKLFEEVVRGTPAELIAHFEAKAPRGEFVLVIGGAPAPDPVSVEAATPEVLARAVAALEATGVDRKTAMKEVGNQYGLTKRDVYQALLSQKEATE
jgi:16S rRNA (cytidine1402-2'-O)-methyltransferase